MKRGHTDARIPPGLGQDELDCITLQLCEPWFLDLRGFLRWHQTCRRLWKVYCDRDQQTLHYLLTQKRERQAMTGIGSRQWETRANYRLLGRAVLIAAVCHLIDQQLDRVFSTFLGGDKKRGPLGACVCTSGVEFDSLVMDKLGIEFDGGTNAAALTLLQQCRCYVRMRYGWLLCLTEAKPGGVDLSFPWKPEKTASALRLVVYPPELERHGR